MRLRVLALVFLAVGCGASRPPETGSWRPMAQGVGLVMGPPSVWTGSEFIVWGQLPGNPLNCQSPPCTTAAGARYNPTTDKWTGMLGAGPPLLTARYATHAIWTGQEMLLWGGGCVGGAGGVCGEGGAYDPTKDMWRAMNEVGAPAARSSFAAGWTGTRMLVWGGMIHVTQPAPGGLQCVNDGGAYDPAADALPRAT